MLTAELFIDRASIDVSEMMADDTDGGGTPARVACPFSSVVVT